MNFFKSEVTKFILNKKLEQVLPLSNAYYLTEVGLPSKIVYQDYSYSDLNFNGSYLVLGVAKNYSDNHFLLLDTTSGKIYHQWNFKSKPSELVFINSDLKKLITSIFIYDFVIRKLILRKSLGTYHEYHEKYASLLKELIFDIDEEATKRGAWSNLIEEMSLGVI